MNPIRSTAAFSVLLPFSMSCLLSVLSSQLPLLAVAAAWLLCSVAGQTQPIPPQGSARLIFHGAPGTIGYSWSAVGDATYTYTDKRVM